MQLQKVQFIWRSGNGLKSNTKKKKEYYHFQVRSDNNTACTSVVGMESKVNENNKEN